MPKTSLDIKPPWLSLLIMLALLLIGNIALAQATTIKQQARQDILADIVSKNDKAEANPVAHPDPARPRSLPGASTDPETKRRYERALQDYYEYRSEGLQHRRAVFKWQLFSAKLIFIIVLVLVGCGIVFAAIQFRHGMHEQDTATPKNNNLSTEMEISSQGIKINSPVLGVIILTLSLAFFYLYLVYVYPIENIF